MMASSHAATGLIAGLLATAALSPVFGAGPVELAAGAAVGAGAALLPDVDHPASTVTRFQGPVTRLVSAGARWISAAVYHRTATAADTARNGEHRHLWHTPAAALAAGAALGTAASLNPWALGAVLWFTIGVGLRGLTQSPTRRRRGDQPLSRPLATLAAAVIALLLVRGGASPGPYAGVIVAAGMLVHSFGDALTRSAVPLAWPLRIRGRRWAMLGTPRCLRFATGAWPERVVRVACLAAVPAVWIAIV
ncbi:metal-dependent hydrolase [Streptomonospora alba]